MRSPRPRNRAEQPWSQRREGKQRLIRQLEAERNRFIEENLGALAAAHEDDAYAARDALVEALERIEVAERGYAQVEQRYTDLLRAVPGIDGRDVPTVDLSAVKSEAQRVLDRGRRAAAPPKPLLARGRRPDHPQRGVSALAPPTPSFEAWRPRSAYPCGRPPTYCRWSVGDWLVSHEKDHRGYVPEDSYDAALAILAAGGVRVTRADLYLCAHVARTVEPESRWAGLSWSHHRELVTVAPERRDELLALAEREGWSCTQLREQLRAGKEWA